VSTPLLEQLREFAEKNDWDGVLAAGTQIQAMAGPAAERAEAVHILGRAHWNRAHTPGIENDPWDLKLAVQFARQALALASEDHDLQGRITKALGTRLVTIGRFTEGRKLLQRWMFYHYTSPVSQVAALAEAQYSLGYSYRYEADLIAAEQWYNAAVSNFGRAGNTDWVQLTTCALAQVQARQGHARVATGTLAQVPIGGPHEAYRLKAQAEVYASAGADFEALVVGEQASEALLELDDQDPWELAELHLLLADLQSRAGNRTEQLKHLALAQDVLRTSPRHDLYRLACMLLDYDRKEVSA